jgi:hypothetical protein
MVVLEKPVPVCDAMTTAPETTAELSSVTVPERLAEDV